MALKQRVRKAVKAKSPKITVELLQKQILYLEEKHNNLVMLVQQLPGALDERGAMLVQRIRKVVRDHAFLISTKTGQIHRWTEALENRPDMRPIPALDAIRIIDGEAKTLERKTGFCPTCHGEWGRNAG